VVSGKQPLGGEAGAREKGAQYRWEGEVWLEPEGVSCYGSTEIKTRKPITGKNCSPELSSGGYDDAGRKNIDTRLARQEVTSTSLSQEKGKILRLHRL